MAEVQVVPVQGLGNVAEVELSKISFDLSFIYTSVELQFKFQVGTLHQLVTKPY